MGSSLMVLLGGLASIVVPSLVSNDLSRTVVVRLYDAVGLMRTAEAQATAVAADLLRSARVTVQWRHCGARSPERACSRPIGDDGAAREVVVRIVRSADGASEHATRRWKVLGEALVDTVQSRGDLATVYYDRVLLLAADAGLESPLLLGRAVAHELGHLLLGTRDHAATGVMRGDWTARDLRRRRAPEDWRFTEPDAEAIARNARRWSSAGPGVEDAGEGARP